MWRLASPEVPGDALMWLRIVASMLLGMEVVRSSAWLMEVVRLLVVFVLGVDVALGPPWLWLAVGEMAWVLGGILGTCCTWDCVWGCTWGCTRGCTWGCWGMLLAICGT